MSRLDDRLTRELEHAARPADPAGAFEQVSERHRRRRRMRKIRSGALIAVVLTGTVAGFTFLSNAFRERGDVIGAATDENGAIVYAQVRNAGEHLWVTNPNGTQPRQLTTDQGVSDSEPSVSPDGTTVAFTRIDATGYTAVWSIGIDGSGLRQLGRFDGPSSGPAWSPDGTEIAFVGPGGSGSAIWTMYPDGSHSKVVTDVAGTASGLTWSPDGSHIAYAAPGDATAATPIDDLWITDIHGFTQVNITATTEGSATSPSWSPDGSRILFARSKEAGTELMTIAPDPDATPVPLTDGSNLDQDPSWSPDGTRILFDRTSTTGADVYTMRPDGSDLTLVAKNATDPAWQPTPAEATGSPVPSPTPAGPIDMGMGFPVCDPRTMLADMDGNGTLDAVTVATKMSDAAGCPARGTTTEVVAIDLNGDGKADGVGGPLSCPSGCEPFAAPDLDADGHPDLALSVENLADGTRRIELFRVTIDAAGTATIIPFTDPVGDPSTFIWGTDSTGLISGVSCTSRITPPLVIAWQATPTGTSSFSVAEHGYHVIDTTLRSAFNDTYTVPGEETVFPDGGGATMCGAPAST